MTFQYRVRDSLGNKLDGTLEAVSLEDATQQLRRDGFEILDLDEDDDDGGLLPRRVSKSEIIYTTSQLSIMVETGITLSTALDGIVEQEQNPTLRAVLAELRDAVEGGEDFSTALARHPKHFDRRYVSLVKASEATGSLGAMLERIAMYLRKELEARSRVRAAMTYPLVMMVMATGVTAFLLTYILPKFTPIFKSKGMELPKPTRFMMAISDVLVGYWYIWTAALLAGIVAFLILRRTESGRRVLDRLKISLPILGPVFRKVVISRSIRTLATMLSSGVSVVDSLKLSAEVAGNCHYKQLWLEVLDGVTAGKRMCEVLAGNPLLPSVLVQMISSGEETGKLATVLERLSNHYDQEVDTALKTATSLIEPIMISVMGVVVGGIALALLLPIFSLSRQP
jgi:type IV pilus assembly protein PilC